MLLSLLMGEVRVEAGNAETLLQKAGTFAMGGIGYGGIMSEGERALREVLAEPDAVARLESLLPESSAAGQLYALVGLRVRDREAYKRALAAFGQRSAAVQTMRGCIGMRVPFRELVKQIDQGDYDTALSREGPKTGR